MDVTVGKAINLYQLGLEMGNNPSFRMIGPYDDGTRIISCDADGFEAAIGAHVADPSIVAPTSESGRGEQDPVIVAAEAIETEITTRLAPGSINSVLEVKHAITDGLAAAVKSLKNNQS